MYLKKGFTFNQFIYDYSGKNPKRQVEMSIYIIWNNHSSPQNFKNSFRIFKKFWRLTIFWQCESLHIILSVVENLSLYVASKEIKVRIT